MFTTGNWPKFEGDADELGRPSCGECFFNKTKQYTSGRLQVQLFVSSVEAIRAMVRHHCENSGRRPKGAPYPSGSVDAVAVPFRTV